jgi:hypothetical protein
MLRTMAVSVVVLLEAGIAYAEEASTTVGVVSHIKVLSDKVEDVSSLEAWKKTFIKEGMTDQEKAVAIWKTVVKYRHQTAPPNEWLQQLGNVHDVMKTIHVYGYGMCCCASANIEQLGRYVGLDARGWAINVHSVPELLCDGKWRLLDASLMNRFRNPDGSLAGVHEIAKAVKEWHKANPGYRGDDGKLRKFGSAGNWRRSGPALLATCDTYTEDGPNAAGYHGWSSTMIEYDKAEEHYIYEYGYSQGYRPNIQLRPGERLTRNWFNKGLHVNMDDGKGPDEIMKSRKPLGLQQKMGDLAPGRVGNGTIAYDVPIDPKAIGDGPLVVRMPSSYVYLDGEVKLKAVIADGGSLKVSFSDNNGLDWKALATIEVSGEHRLDLKSLCFRRYDYRLKFELKGALTRIERLRIANDIQHSQAPLPALGKGENIISFSAGPAEGTITVEGSTEPTQRGKQLVAADFHPSTKGVKEKSFRVKEYGPPGQITFPVETPGDLVRIRAGAHYRARDAREGWTLQASFDDGKTFSEVGKLPGPAAGSSRYFSFNGVPKGAREALVRFQSTSQHNTLCLFDFRIDADYAEPAGGFRPVQVTYVWEEAGAEMRHVHVANSPTETYTIKCEATPRMKSIILELATAN